MFRADSVFSLVQYVQTVVSDIWQRERTWGCKRLTTVSEEVTWYPAWVLESAGLGWGKTASVGERLKQWPQIQRGWGQACLKPSSLYLQIHLMFPLARSLLSLPHNNSKMGRTGVGRGIGRDSRWKWHSDVSDWRKPWALTPGSRGDKCKVPQITPHHPEEKSTKPWKTPLVLFPNDVLNRGTTIAN